MEMFFINLTKVGNIYKSKNHSLDMPKKKRVVKKKAKVVPRSRVNRGFAIFLFIALIFSVLAFSFLMISGGPTGNVITGHASAAVVKIDVSLEQVEFADGKVMSYSEYQMVFCSKSACVDPGSHSCAANVCAIDLSSGSSKGDNTPSSGFVYEMFGKWGEGQLDINVAKYLFLIIVTLMIFSALSLIKLPENGGVQFILAAAIAFLATAYITPEEVFAILTAYTALGLTLSVIVPFVVMVIFSATLLGGSSKLDTKEMTIPKIVLQAMLWLFFTVFLGYKVIGGFGNDQVSNPMMILMLVITGLSLGVFVLNRKFRYWVYKIGFELNSVMSKEDFDDINTAMENKNFLEYKKKNKGKRNVEQAYMDSRSPFHKFS